MPRTPLPAELFCYSTSQHSWQQLQMSGEDVGPRLGHSITSIGRDLYIFGGRTGIHFADSTLGDLFKLNVDTWVCEEVQALGSSPEPRSYHAAASSGGNLYIFGGCGAEGRLNDLHELDTVSNTWRRLPSHSDIKVTSWAVGTPIQDALSACVMVSIIMTAVSMTLCMPLQDTPPSQMHMLLLC